MAKWIAAEKDRAGLRHAVVCPNVTGMTKDRKAQRKRVRTGSLPIVDTPRVARNCNIRAFDLQMCHAVFLRYYLCFVLFRFRLFASIEAAPLRSIDFDMHAPRRSHALTLPNNLSVAFLFYFLIILFGGVAFSGYFCTIAVLSLY